MSCANPFAWAQQSNEHRMHALNHYPLIYELVATVDDYAGFAKRVQALNPSQKNMYNQEYQRWYKAFGRVWERISCLPENTLGEHTNNYSFQEKPPTTRPFLNSPISGLGATGQMPPLPTNYRWCDPPAVGGMAITSERQVEGFFGWTYKIWVGGNDRNYYLFHDQMTNEDYWACPPNFNITADKTEVKKIQSALLSKGYNPGVVDGIWGPNTCQASYSFQRNELKEYGGTLTSQFFFALGASGFGTKYANACEKYYTGDLGPDPDFVPAATPLAVKRALLSLGYNPGPLTNVWDREVCEAAFQFKKTTLGESDTILGKTFFQALGLKGTLDVTECQKYAGTKPTPKPEPTPEPVAEEAKASLGWIALVLGAGAIGTVAYKKWKESR